MSATFVPKEIAVSEAKIILSEYKVENLQNTIENLNLQMLDQEEENSHLKDTINKLEKEINHLKAKQPVYDDLMAERNYAVARLAEEISKNKKITDIAETRKLVLQDTAKKIEDLLKDNANVSKKIEEIKSQAEHLAKKSIQLTRENIDLKKELSSVICQGARTGEISSLCGECISCQLDRAKYTIETYEIVKKKQNEPFEDVFNEYFNDK